MHAQFGGQQGLDVPLSVSSECTAVEKSLLPGQNESVTCQRRTNLSSCVLGGDMMPVGLLSSLHLGAGLHNLQRVAIHLQLAGSSGSAACLGRCSTSSAMLAEDGWHSCRVFLGVAVRIIV